MGEGRLVPCRNGESLNRRATNIQRVTSGANCTKYVSFHANQSENATYLKMARHRNLNTQREAMMVSCTAECKLSRFNFFDLTFALNCLSAHFYSTSDHEQSKAMQQKIKPCESSYFGYSSHFFKGVLQKTTLCAIVQQNVTSQMSFS